MINRVRRSPARARDLPGGGVHGFGRRGPRGDDVASIFLGRAQAAQPALVDGFWGATWAPGGKPRPVRGFTIVDGMVVAIDIDADPETLGRSYWRSPTT